MKKKLLLITSIVSGLTAIFTVFFPLVLTLILKAYIKAENTFNNSAASIGIIGSSDGPTAIFVSNTVKGTAFRYGFAVICTVISAVTAVLFYKSNKEGKKQ